MINKQINIAITRKLEDVHHVESHLIQRIRLTALVNFQKWIRRISPNFTHIQYIIGIAQRLKPETVADFKPNFVVAKL